MGDEKRPAPAKVFDIAKPGKVAALPTSKEILTTKRPNDDEPEPTVAELARRAHGGEKRIERPDVDDEDTESPVISKFSDEAEPSHDEPETHNQANNENLDDETSDESEHPDKVDELKKADVANREKAAHDKQIDELVANHKYYLPINQVEKRRNARTAVIGVVVVLVLALAWFDIALDAGLLTLPGITAPTHFFR